MGNFISRVQRPKVVSEFVQTEEESTRSNYDNMSTPKCYMNTNQELDPRSITRGVPRTPLMLFVNGKDDEDVTPKKAPKKTDLEILEEEMRKVTLDLQQMIKDDSTIDYDEIEVEDEIIIHTQEEIAVERDEEENVMNITPVAIEEIEETPICEKSFTENSELQIDEDVPEKIVRTPENPKLQDLRKKLFLTPNMGLKTPEPPKTKSGRTPLGAVCPNRSPVVKEWRGFDDERRKLGLENTPPASILPVPDQIQSAPGKMLIQRSKLNRPRWDNENTLFI